MELSNACSSSNQLDDIKMQLHDRYTNLPAVDFKYLYPITDNSLSDIRNCLHQIILIYNQEIMNGCCDRNKLEAFRMILCYEYQQIYKTKQIPHPMPVIAINVKSTSLLHLSEHNFPIFLDIITLQVVLFCNTESLLYHLQKFHESNSIYIVENSHVRILYIKIFGSFLDAFHLQSFIWKEDYNKNAQKKMAATILKDMETWLTKAEDSELKYFPTFFFKSIAAVGKEHILDEMWNLILTKKENLQSLFTILCITVDTWLLLDSSNTVNENGSLCFKEELWSLLLKGLTSPTQYIRKQALYLIKKINEMTCSFDIETVKSGIIPFICKTKIEGDFSINNIKNIFVLILEALEEKQKHLITPVLPFLTTLITGSQIHKRCGDCFNIAWLHVVFERILRHENSSITKHGLITALRMDSNLYNDQFIKLLVQSLNNISLYKYENNEECPQIVRELTGFFVRAGHLISCFLWASAEISWGPVAIFHITSAIRMIPLTNCQWNRDCLKAVKCLIKKNLQRYSKILRFASQINMIEALTFFTNEEDVLLIGDVLSAFPKDESLCRGFYAWELLVNWLAKNKKMKKKSQQFVIDVCEALRKDSNFPLSVDSIALLMTLLYDAGFIFVDKDCPAKRALCNLLTHLNDICARPYANLAFTIQVFKLLSHLLSFCSQKDEKDKIINGFLLPYIDIGITFVLTKLKTSTDLNVEIVESLIMIATICLNGNKNESLVIHFINECRLLLKKTINCDGIRRLFGMKIWYLCEEITFKSVSPNFKHCADYDECIHTLLNVYKTPMYLVSGFETTDLKGKIVSEYYTYVVKLIILLLKRHLKTENIDWLQHISDFLDTVGKDVLPFVLELLHEVVSRKLFDKENLLPLEKLIQLCWKHALHYKKSSSFLAMVDWLTQTIHILILQYYTESWILLQEVMQDMLEEGNVTPSLKKVLLLRLGNSDVKYSKIILVNCLLHGPVIRQDQKIEIQTCEAIVNKFERKKLSDFQSDIVSHLNYNVDAVVRALATTILFQQTITSHDTSMNDVFFALIRKLIENKGKRYFCDSYVHRVNNRILQTMLLFQPTVSKKCTIELHNLLYGMILSDSHQRSVRLMIEWLLIRIYLENTDLQNNLWKLFKEVNEKRPGSLHSVLCIIYHVSRNLPLNAKKMFIDTALSRTSSCCMGQQFNMRLYSQVLFVKMYELLESIEDSKNIKERYRNMYDVTSENIRHGNLMTHSVKLRDDFYLTVFDSSRHYSLETIYYDILRLTNVCAEEWIHPQIFRQLDFLTSNEHPVSLETSDRGISQAKIPQDVSKSQDHEENSIKIDMLDNMQKKIIPRKTLASFADELEEIVVTSEKYNKIFNSEYGIIVVASLVERLPNLGGIARTCEIFGVKELIISNHKHVQNKEFKNLSVSAERWINVTEIRPYQLPEYFLNKKELGWSIIGAEQTINSISLTNMKFDKKTVLVLGNEKDGIPANFIPLLDNCVEIPQVGVTRSLNVHVTSAICIWQYVSQHMLN